MSDITELYCLLDEFCQEFEPLFHQIRYRQFKAFYLMHVQQSLQREFPQLPSYSRIVERHKTFAGLAQRGKNSTGWFFGFKLHILINHFWTKVTSGNVDDRAARHSPSHTPFDTAILNKHNLIETVFDQLKNLRRRAQTM